MVQAEPAHTCWLLDPPGLGCEIIPSIVSACAAWSIWRDRGVSNTRESLGYERSFVFR